MKEINFSKNTNSQPIVEITLQVRDKNGKPTGKTKSYSGESCRDASDWYNKQKPGRKKKRKKNK
jgi:hypothetical protein|tara:strand:+ start:306 stop:497 length:192 start_codon:yes stop_codon:yes gene_type:complete